MKDKIRNDDENKEHKNKLDRCCCLPLQRLADLNSGSGSAGPFTVTVGTVFTLPIAVNIVSVSVDTDDFLTDPCMKECCCHRNLRVLLTFIADISVNALSLGTTLSFNLVRSSCNGTVPLGPTSTFSITIAAGFPQSAAFVFEYLDKDIEPGNYTYSVQLVPGSSVTGAVGVLGASVLIQAATLSAIAAFI